MNMNRNQSMEISSFIKLDFSFSPFLNFMTISRMTEAHNEGNSQMKDKRTFQVAKNAELNIHLNIITNNSTSFLFGLPHL